MIELELPDGTIVEFPDEASPEVIQQTAKRLMGVEQAPQAVSTLPPVVAEGASALNRGFAAIPDFFIDAANAATGLVSDEIPKIPRVQDTLSDLSGGAFGQKNFMEPGLARTIVQEGGEFAPGAAMGLVQPAKTMVGITDELADAARGSVSKTLRESAPTLEQLRQRSDDIYKQIDDLGVTFKGSAISNLADDIERTLVKSGLDENLTPKTAALLKRIRSDSEGPLTATQLDTLRKIAQGPANDVDSIGKATADSRLGTIVIKKIDDFLNAPPEGALASTADDVGPLFSQARQLVSQRKKGEMIQEAFNKASLQASGFENGLRVQFRSILNSPSKRRGFDAAELKAMKQVVEGGKIENMARVFGKFGLSTDLSGGGFLAGITALGGIAAGGGPGGAAAGGVVALASGAKQLARSMTNSNAALANATVRAGKNGRKIVSAYLKNTPKSYRSAEQLTGLLLNNQIPINQLRTLANTQNSLVANAAYSSIVLNNALGEDQKPEPSAQ